MSVGRRIILGVIATVWVGWPPVAGVAEAGGIIRLKSAVTVRAPVVLLRDLAEDAPPALGALRLFSSPPWGAEKMVTAVQIRHRLAVLTSRSFATEGADEVRIRSLGGDRTKEVQARFNRELAARTTGAGSATFDPKFPPRRILLPSGPLDMVLRLPRRDHGAGVIHATLKVSGKVIKTIAVPCRVSRQMSVPVARGDLAVGDTLAASDYAWVKRRVERRMFQPFTPGTNVTGYRVTRRVREGDILSHQSLEIRPAVYRGESIDLIVRRANITVTGRARALQDGWVGSRIRVKNLITNRLVYGRVAAKGVVLYE